jgi:tRNA U34 5-methylaminomethyl-2-thiouridine-forming methyltransferase MnmC
MLKREFMTTADGSASLHIPEWNEHYHSKHGAVQESEHVFKHMGLDYYKDQHDPSSLSILEAGFGTGLNALISLAWAKKHQINVRYCTLEAYPVGINELKNFNFHTYVKAVNQGDFLELHECDWEQPVEISTYFTLHKQQQQFKDLDAKSTVDVIFYDAFGPRVQPDLWEMQSLERFYHALKPKGIFVTYCAKGQVRRNLEQLGFQTERLPGPPGKREMLRGTKL